VLLFGILAPSIRRCNFIFIVKGADLQNTDRINRMVVLAQLAAIAGLVFVFSLNFVIDVKIEIFETVTPILLREERCLRVGLRVCQRNQSAFDRLTIFVRDLAGNVARGWHLGLLGIERPMVIEEHIRRVSGIRICRLRIEHERECSEDKGSKRQTLTHFVA